MRRSYVYLSTPWGGADHLLGGRCDSWRGLSGYMGAGRFAHLQRHQKCTSLLPHIYLVQNAAGRVTVSFPVSWITSSLRCQAVHNDSKIFALVSP